MNVKYTCNKCKEKKADYMGSCENCGISKEAEQHINESIMMDDDKFILDACCSARMMWFNKNHPNTLYIDIREEEKGFIESRPNREIKPDILADFRDLNILGNKKFKLIVWDPPHLLGKNYKSRITKNYGFLVADSFDYDFSKGFDELWKHLEVYGVLIFKFNDYHIPFKRVLNLFPVKPLFGNTISKNKNSKTKWFCFMKMP